VLVFMFVMAVIRGASHFVVSLSKFQVIGVLFVVILDLKSLFSPEFKCNFYLDSVVVSR
jgi:hypothetical protein